MRICYISTPCGCNGRFMQGYGKVPASAHSACIGVYVFAPAGGATPPLQAIRSLQGHPTGGPSLRDGHSQSYLTESKESGARESRHTFALVPDLTLVKTNANIVPYAHNLVVIIENPIGWIHND